MSEAVPPERLSLSGSRAAVLLLPPAAKGVSDAEHDDFGDGDTLDEQEGAIGAENPQRAFDLAPPVKRQFAGDDFDELKICVRGRREAVRRDASHHQVATIMPKAGLAFLSLSCDFCLSEIGSEKR